MPQYTLFDKVIVDIPHGFTPTIGPWVASFSQKKPFRMIGIADCSAAPGGSGYADIRMQRGAAADRTTVEYAKKIFPNNAIREVLLQIPPHPSRPTFPTSYCWHVHLPDFHDLNLLLEFNGLGDFETELPIWHEVLSSLSQAITKECNGDRMLDDSKIALKEFTVWGKNTPEWTSELKKRAFSIDYPENEASPYDRQIIVDFRKREAIIADAVSARMFASFLANDYPFFEGAGEILEEFGIRAEKPKDIIDHMFLDAISVLPSNKEGGWQLCLHFSITWNAHGVAVFIGGLLNKGEADNEITVKLENEY